MSAIKLTSAAEKRAEKAENLTAFSGMKLLHIKKQIALALAQIGRANMFDQYTKHDISHIDYMLESLEWLIPEETKLLMTSSDWLMITLAIYFHDLGMLVTNDEFKQRDKTFFKSFKQSIIDGEFGQDFKVKIFNLDGVEEQDRFIYQEYVRKTHAERIKYWILEENNPIYPEDIPIIAEIKKLISNADKMFRRDLALVCESHHLSDLEDLEKYKPNQQYGASTAEKVNLHYCALILRTADLLHITSDRTPSIEYSIINPSDPVSQEEWAKQGSVKAIRVKEIPNYEGVVEETKHYDTLEVIAMFEKDEGFFGLISYLNYANTQLKENFRLNELANKTFGYNFGYPWLKIDDSAIETENFEKKQFEFILDQTKILDLLVGHTLYNDSSVVIRELTQNAIDATKLKKYEFDNEGSNSYEPEINISWSSKDRVLTFMDNGTGMTLEIIQNHLLKVGSSRYQDENFKKHNPEFSSISRFGIGLLTCFLIANDIDIITKSVESDKAILLRVKKVHGKYLLKYLNVDKLPNEIKEHGTIVKLFARTEVELSKIEKELKNWIMFPECKLTFTNDGKESNVGYKTPAEALKVFMENEGLKLGENRIKIKEVYENGITMAYALKYIEHWKEWRFMETNNHSELENSPIGTCIEGIRVDFNTPGFKNQSIYSIVNSTGKNAPKTNVARSNIEVTSEKEALLKTIYTLYLQHISDQIVSLINQGFSITWAASEGQWLLSIFTTFRASFREDIIFEDLEIFEKSLLNTQCILIENDNKRELKSINELKKLKHFWMIDCKSYSSADSLIKEVKASNTSGLALLDIIFGNDESNIGHIDTLLCNNNLDENILKLIGQNFQVDYFKIIPSQRRIDLKWSIIEKKIWEEVFLNVTEEDSYSKCLIQLHEIEFNGLDNQTAIRSNDTLYILKNSALNSYLVKMIDQFSNGSREDEYILSHIVSITASFYFRKNHDKSRIEEYIEHRFKDIRRGYGIEDFETRCDKSEMVIAILKTDLTKYDNNVWSRFHTAKNSNGI